MNSSSTYLASDVSQFGRMRLEAREPTPELAREVAGQFEGLFVQMMLKSMRDAQLGGGIFDTRDSQMFTEMFDQQIATEISSSHGLGLSDLVMRQLGFEPETVRRTEPKGTSEAAFGLRQIDTRADAVARTQHSAQSAAWAPEGPAEFVQQLWSTAQETARKLGVSARGLLAQAALETGWGRRMPARIDGSSSFNLFGIKADARWQGDRVSQQTLEFRDGVGQREHAQFRAYESLEQSFADYAQFLQGNPRYEQVLSAGSDTRQFVQELQKSGYATDPEYASKLLDIAENTLAPLLPE